MYVPCPPSLKLTTTHLCSEVNPNFRSVNIEKFAQLKLAWLSLASCSWLHCSALGKFFFFWRIKKLQMRRRKRHIFFWNYGHTTNSSSKFGFQSSSSPGDGAAGPPSSLLGLRCLRSPTILHQFKLPTTNVTFNCHNAFINQQLSKFIYHWS